MNEVTGTPHKTCEVIGCNKLIIYELHAKPDDCLTSVMCYSCYQSATIDFISHDHDVVVESIHRCDPHMASVVKDIKQVIPPTFHDKVCIAGGFATHMAGITTRYDDIDIYCHNYDDFLSISARFRRESKESESAERVVSKVDDEKYPFRRTMIMTHGLSLDIICLLNQRYTSASFSVAPTMLFDNFDINWSLAMINLTDENVYVSNLAFSNSLYINRNRATNTFDNLASRIEKYHERLRRKTHRGHKVMQFLPKRIGKVK